MNDLYTKDYLENTLVILESELDDLETWSVYNGDHKLDEISQLKSLFKTISAQLTK